MTEARTGTRLPDHPGEPSLDAARPGLAYRWGVAMARGRWVVLAAWCIILPICAIGYPTLQNRLTAPDYGVDRAESTQVSGIVAQRFPQLGDEQDTIVFRADDSTVDAAAQRATIRRAVGTARALPGVVGVVDPFTGLAGQVAANRQAALAIVGIAGDTEQLARATRALQTELHQQSTATMSIGLTGYTPISNDMTGVETNDVERAEAIGIPVAIVVLILALGALVAAAVPILTAVAGLLASFGALLLLSYVLKFDSIVVTIATMLGTGVGIDYALFVVSRFREELGRRGRGTSLREVTGAACATAGTTIAASGVIVMLSLCSLTVISAPIFRQIAIGVTTSVACTLVVSLTLLPAVLATLGARIDRGALPARLRPPDAAAPHTSSRWARWARLVMAHPIMFGGVVAGVLVVAALPLSHIRYGIDLGAASAHGTPSGQALEVITDEFTPGLLAPIDIVATGPGDRPTTAADQTAIDRFDADVGRNPLIAAHFTQTTAGRTLITAIPAVPIDSTAATDLVIDLRRDAKSYAAAGPTILVGGTTAGFVDLSTEITHKLPLALGLVLALSLLFLLIIVRGVVVAVKAIVMNLLGTAAAIGLTVAVFQWGWAHTAIGFAPTGFLQVYLPVSVFAVLFGLSMDYEVFLVRRMKETWDATGDNNAAVVDGIEHTGRPITAAAAIMVAIFASFISADVLELKQFGFALATAVALDALLIRLVLVPALMRLFGRRNWWMPTVGRRPQVDAQQHT